MKILFVDDDPGVLQGLRRLLRKRRHNWDMAFVESGPAALKTLTHSHRDVIVTDMRMPDMDGAELLRIVHDEFPDVVRIVLSGYADMEAAVRAIHVAHQFLNKPCNPESLINVIERGCGLRRFLHDADLRSLVGSIDSLPALPAVYSELCQALADSDVALDDLGRIVEEDMAISAKILQMVNSSFFGLAQTVASIREAVSYLGTDLLRHVVLGIEVFRAFEASPGNTAFCPEREQEHAQRTAALATRLLVEKKEREAAFMAGMLHGVGKLVLASYRSADHERAATLARSKGVPLWMGEQEVFGVSHAQVGAYLLGLWGMPYSIIEAVAHQHVPSRIEPPTFGVLGALHVANSLIQTLSARDQNDSRSPPLAMDHAYLERSGAGQMLPEWTAMAEEMMSATQGVS